MSQILTIRRILTGVRAKKLEAAILSADFSKAFDAIHREKMGQILLTYGLPKEILAAIMMLYRNTKVKAPSPDGDMDYFDILPDVLQGETFAPYLFIICPVYVLIMIKWKTTVSSWQRKEAEDTPDKQLPTRTTPKT